MPLDNNFHAAQRDYDAQLPPEIAEDEETGEQREVGCEHKWLPKGGMFKCSRCGKWSE